MNRSKGYIRQAKGLLGALVVLGGLSAPILAEPVIDEIHFLIPGGAGGGWDGTARGTGEALKDSGIVGNVSFENMSGGGGGKAIGFLIESAESSNKTLMVNSTPIVINSLTKRFPFNFRDLTLIAGTIGDYQALIVPSDSPYTNFNDITKKYSEDPNSISVGGGSVPGSLDHLTAAMVFRAAGLDATKMKYIPYDSGGALNAAVLGGEVDLGSTGFSEAVSLVKSGEFRFIGVTSSSRVDAYPDAPTFKEQGVDVDFVNWRGFFAAPGLEQDLIDKYRAALAAMYDTPEWEIVRERNGWVNIHNSGAEFEKFLIAQEDVIQTLMIELGFID